MANKSNSSMRSDQYFVEMLKIMREQGRKDNPVTLQLGIMKSANSVKVGDLVLSAEDIYIAEHLVSGYTREVEVPYVDDVLSNGEPTVQDSITFSDGLKKGDLVAVQKLQNTNKYVILAKVVAV